MEYKIPLEILTNKANFDESKETTSEALNEINFTALNFPITKPISRKMNSSSDSKKNKIIKTKKLSIHEKNSTKNNQNKKPFKLSSLNKFSTDHFNDNIKSQSNSITGNSRINSKMNSLNSSFSSTGSCQINRNNLSKKTNPFTTNIYTIKYPYSNKYNNNLNSSCQNQNKLLHNINDKYIKNQGKIEISKKKFTQKISNRLNKDTKLFMEKLKNDKRIDTDPDLKREYLVQYLFTNLANFEADVNQIQIQDLNSNINKQEEELSLLKAEFYCTRELNEMKTKKNQVENSPLEEEIRKYKSELVIIEEKEKEYLYKVINTI